MRRAMGAFVRRTAGRHLTAWGNANAWLLSGTVKQNESETNRVGKQCVMTNNGDL